MPKQRILPLVTIAALLGWKKKGKSFVVRYDLVEQGSRSVAPAYNVIYIVDDEENILVSTNPGRSGLVEHRRVRFWPGIIRHHEQYGDGTMLVYDPVDQTISTWSVGEDGAATRVSFGKDLTRQDEQDTEAE